MLTKTNVTIEERGVDGRKLFRTEILFAEERIDGPRGGRGKKAALRIHPRVVRLDGSVGIGRAGTLAGAEEHGPRGAQRDELVRVHGQRVPPARVFEVVARHPVVETGGQIFDGLAELAAMQLGAALT